MNGVYAIRNTLTDDRYIGSSKNIAGRWTQHRRSLNSGTHSNCHLQNAWKKYGGHVFVCEVVEVAAAGADARTIEQRHLDAGLGVYNILASAFGGVRSHGQTARERNRVSQLRNWADPDYRATHPGRPQSDSAREKIRAARRLQAPPWLGKKRPAATVEKMRRARLGRPNPHGRPSVEKTCPQCERRFFVKATTVSWRKYCSRPCMGLAYATSCAGRLRALAAARRGLRSKKWRRVELACAECGAAIVVHRYRLAPGRKHYCSHRCMGLSHARARWHGVGS